MISDKTKKIILTWLLCGCFLVFSMVIIGGITRLTQSGLSMVEWDFIIGSVPPLNEPGWQTVFEKYKQSPEFKKVNYDFGVEQFKTIFWWEYIHRFLGRLIGIVFIIPFIFFLYKKWLSPSFTKKCFVLLLLGAAQGGIGWYMVKSGLVNDAHVSHYRLAVHLITAFILFGYILAVALELAYGKKTLRIKELAGLRIWTNILIVSIILQIIYGAFVAGLDAGMVYNTFPKMGDSWVADGVTALSPFVKNFTQGLAGVQFVHRYIAYIIVFLVCVIWLKSRNKTLTRHQKSGINFLLIMVLMQFTLGVLTLVFAIPVFLAVMHQAGALLLFGGSIFVAKSLR